MWGEYYLDPAPPTSRTMGADLPSRAIHVIPPADGDVNMEDGDEDEEEDLLRDEVVAERWCEKCGRKFYGSQEEHDDDATHMTTIGPRLRLGAAWNASNPDELARSNVGTIVSMASELIRKPFVATIRYKNFFLEDDEREFAIPALIRSTGFLHEVLSDKNDTKAVLVHCAVGRSRSVSAVIAYLMFSEQLSATAAFQKVKSLRPGAQPNSGYIQQLHALDVLFRRLPTMTCLLLVADYCPQHGLNRSLTLA